MMRTACSLFPNTSVHTFTALCAAGIEPLVVEELRSFGAGNIHAEKSAVVFQGSLETAYRTCLWSRYANRILLPIAQSKVHNADDLYEAARAVAWSDHLSPDDTFAVHCTSVDAAVPHTQFAALRIKDGIVDYYKDRYGRRPTVRRQQPDVAVHVFLNGSEATLSIDLSGESLHLRGYRAGGGRAPLKETLGAALVRLSGWPDQTTPDSIFLDPCCGSATLLIEAALLYGGITPRWGRTYYGFLKWLPHNPDLWKSLVAEAAEQRRAARAAPWPTLVGYDASRTAVETAVANVARAGFERVIRIEQQELAFFRIPPTAPTGGHGVHYLVTNPPYGERLDQQGAERYLYRCLGRMMRRFCKGWKAAVFTRSVELADALGMQPQKKYRLYNGPLPCQLSTYLVPDTPPEPPVQPAYTTAVFHDTAATSDFANRLMKNLRRLLPWAQREGISCFRVYDADLPDYNMAIDIYEQWVHVQEYAAPHEIDPEKARSRLQHALSVIRDVLHIRRDQIFIKVRRPQKRKDRYQKRAAQGKLYEVRENRCRFLVNLSDYLDTGLFLDHRKTRSRIGAQTCGKRFLNLFGYTGTATVYAALGGACETITVDRSPTYAAWALKNFALNGMSSERHTFVRAECVAWLSQTRSRFDLVFADPPTFSNRKGDPLVFDVQRDHVALIHSIMKRLARDGLLIFSTNYRRFTLDPQICEAYFVQDITKQTIPFDFTRTPRIHQCWEIRHR